MSRNLWKTVCSEINIPFFKFCLEYCSPFLNLFENLRLALLIKGLLITKPANSNLITNRSN